MTECLTVYAREMLIRQLEKACGFSILWDKATDITMKKIFCINVRYFFDGKATTHLYRLVSLTSGNAEALFDVLLELFDSDKMLWNKLLGYASDGENLMQGSTNSVLTRMQEKAPGIFVLKCFCHN